MSLHAKNCFKVLTDQPKWPRFRGINSIEELIEEARAGRCFVLVDDYANMGTADVVIPAQFASSSILRWMSRSVHGLILLALKNERIDHLRLKTMAERERYYLQAPFTLSIKAKDAEMTGVPWRDRAHTISVAIDQDSKPGDIVTPGHLFALIAAQGGMLENAGRAEAAIDIAQIAGLNASSVLCEVMDADGLLNTLSEFRNFARQHDMKIGFISDIVAYRLRDEASGRDF
ncbi:MAG: 3,4-dihydroxy-2-butanone-4-phosphate synthase [Proteobacteria bacterium]|nr:3,4-dihydroxy-2-butanone-4-phosphate synthase [Pseudomonadota bacterium]MBS0270886.1 3,4-dihydroxy-2-butanone-4-phosphate synthase [Pseudomonadota bacterium]